MVRYYSKGREGDRQRGCDNNWWFPQDREDFLMARERRKFRLVSVSVLDERTRWWPVSLDSKPPGQCARITEERSHPALTPETYSHNKCVCVCACVCTVLPCQFAQSHHFFVWDIPDVNLQWDDIQWDQRSDNQSWRWQIWAIQCWS